MKKISTGRLYVEKNVRTGPLLATTPRCLLQLLAACYNSSLCLGYNSSLTTKLFGNISLFQTWGQNSVLSVHNLVVRLGVVLLMFLVLSAVNPFICLLRAEENELRPYRLINSDYLNINLIGDEYVTKLRGNVHFFYGDTEFLSDEAEIYDLQKIVIMRGNVEVYDDSLSLFADKAEYFRITDVLHLYTDVLIVEDHQDGTKRTFVSDRGTYNRAKRKIYSYENTVFVDERESATGVCNFLDYDLESGYGYITGEPQVSFSLPDSLNVAAERIEFYRDFNRVAASFNVRTRYIIYQEEADVTCSVRTGQCPVPTEETAVRDSTVYDVYSDFLLLFLEEDYAVFVGQPYFISKDAEAEADRFYLYLEDGRISGATLENNCRIMFAVKEGGERRSRIDAKMVDLLFTEGRITGIEAYNDVKSLYVGDEERDLTVNRAKSDKLNIYFNEDNEIENIVFIGRVKGTYKFEGDLRSSEE